MGALLEIESLRQTGTLSPDTTLAIALSRVGGGDEHQRIVSGTLSELAGHPQEALEVAYAETFAADKENWRAVARNNYGCALDCYNTVVGKKTSSSHC
ncbi:hypothetical protein MPER_06593 [Moniliophthora perniciosa FA553]|nr:hypothetical protein MPER_06593 [Moniliophthora perniciosa FA553]